MRRHLWVTGVVWLSIAAAACGDEDEVVIVSPGPTVAGVFEPCDFDEDCPDFTDCHSIVVDYGDVVVEDAMCTVECFDDFDCPIDGICLDAASGPPLCYQLCFDDLDCPIGFACIDEIIDYTFDATCIPF